MQTMILENITQIYFISIDWFFLCYLSNFPFRPVSMSLLNRTPIHTQIMLNLRNWYNNNFDDKGNAVVYDKDDDVMRFTIH